MAIYERGNFPKFSGAQIVPDTMKPHSTIFEGRHKLSIKNVIKWHGGYQSQRGNQHTDLCKDLHDLHNQYKRI
jgi:hypothetical protein